MWGVLHTPLPYRQERGCSYYPNHHHRPPGHNEGRSHTPLFQECWPRPYCFCPSLTVKAGR